MFTKLNFQQIENLQEKPSGISSKFFKELFMLKKFLHRLFSKLLRRFFQKTIHGFQTFLQHFFKKSKNTELVQNFSMDFYKKKSSRCCFRNHPHRQFCHGISPGIFFVIAVVIHSEIFAESHTEIRIVKLVQEYLYIFFFET